MSSEAVRSPAGPVRILLADDHTLMREGLAALLGAEPGFTVVAQAGSGGEAVELYRRHRPDVGLLDLWMPAMSGTEAIRAIRAEFPQARLIVLTSYDGDNDVWKALQAGACGYLLKGMGRAELLEAVRAVLAGRQYIPPAVANRLAEHIHGMDLTRREMDVLRLMGEGQSNADIAATLRIGASTVKWHVNAILGKLGVTARTQAVVVARRRGLLRT